MGAGAMLDINGSDVGMLDLKDGTLHKPSHVHLITRCGLPMELCKVGPVQALTEGLRLACPECWRGAWVENADGSDLEPR
jgi:hypothetical protein